MDLRAVLLGGLAMTTFVAGPASAQIHSEQDRITVAALDIEYQAAVERNDFAVMERILHEEFVLVLGDGRRLTRAQLLEHETHVTYEVQDEIEGTQTVQVYGDTAVVTALLWLKGEGPSGPFDRRLWFTDTYVRTPTGWRYFYAQASLPLPAEDDS